MREKKLMTSYCNWVIPAAACGAFFIRGTLSSLQIWMDWNGRDQNKFGRYLKKKYEGDMVSFLGAVYDLSLLNNLRYYSRLYFHGHSVGGTNPSLLEAMAARALIVANDNVFNRAVLRHDALYFAS